MSRLAGRGFVVGVGSNLAAERNIGEVLSAFLTHFDQLIVSRIIYTAPEMVSSPQWFINTALFIPCALEPAQLKHICNRIEMDLGRDRAHPQRKWRDRPADLDILHFCHDVSACAGWQVKENYLAPLVSELLAYIQNRACPTIPALTQAHAAYIYIKECMAHPLGQTPATVYRDHTAGLIRII